MRKRHSRPLVAAVERHADRVADLVSAVFDSDGVTDRATRAAAAGADPSLPSGLATYLDLVRESSYRITDTDIAALQGAGHGEEEIFELTVAAALGAAVTRHEAGLRWLRGEL